MKQHVLVIGAFDYLYIRDNWLEPIQHLLAGQCLILDINVLLACMTRAEVEYYILELVQQQEITHIMFYHDVIFADLSDKLFSALHHLSVKVVTFYADDEPPFWYARNIKYDHHYALIGTHSLKAIAKRGKDAPNVVCHYMPWGVNPRSIEQYEQVSCDYDVIFIGRNKDVLGCGLHREDGEIRDLELQRIAQSAIKHNWRFAIFGFGWQNHPTLSTFYAGTVPAGQFFNTLARSRVIFNPAYAWDGVALTAQVKLRHFEVAANGHGLQLTNVNDELAGLLTEDQEIVFYQDADELEQKITLWLGQPARCEQVALQARQRTLREHTIDLRLRGLMLHAGIELPGMVDDCAPDIAHIPYAGSMRQWECAIRQSAAEYIYLGPDKVAVRLDTALLRHVLVERPQVLRAEWMLWGYASQRDAVQPRREEVYACRLRATGIVGRVMPYLKQWLEQIDNHDLQQWLCGAVIRKDILLQYVAKSLAFTELAVKILNHAAIVDCAAMIAFLNIDTRLQQVTTLSPVQCALNDVVALSMCQKLKLIIYGARGDLAESTLHYLNINYPALDYDVVDNGSVGRSMAGRVVLGHRDIVHLEHAIILVCAAYSGPAIMKQCNDLCSTVRLFPLYDLFDDSWTTIYA